MPWAYKHIQTSIKHQIKTFIGRLTLADGYVLLRFFRADRSRFILCPQMVCCGRHRDTKVWRMGHQQHDWEWRHHGMSECCHSWWVPEKDYGKTPLDENTGPGSCLRLFLLHFAASVSDFSWSSCSVERLTRWQWTEERRTQPESVDWFLLWWSSMMKVWYIGQKPLHTILCSTLPFLDD